MKKLQLFIVFLVVIVLLTLADYRITIPDGIKLPETSESPVLEVEDVQDSATVKEYPNVTKIALEASPDITYRIEKRTRTTELFESFDLSNLANTAIYKNILIDSGAQAGFPLYIYEIQGAMGQGKISYLNIKLAIYDQLKPGTSVNETGEYGNASLYYNEKEGNPTGFLISQVGDTVFGFKYAKSQEESLQVVRAFLEGFTKVITQ